jgi:hypothetical protein
VDFIETQRVNIPVLNRLLTTGNVACNVDMDEDIMRLESNSAPMVVLPDMTQIPERRGNARERRTGAPDWRAEKSERRKGTRRKSE